MPRLTIVIPTVNRAELVGRAIESALGQTCRDVEIIVSDNGSTDHTPEVVSRYAGRPGVRTFRHSPTMHITQHSWFLTQQVRGEFVVGLSDDDYLEPEFAAETLAAFDRNPSIAFVYTGCAVHYEDVQVPSLVGPPVESTADFLLNHYSGRRELSWCACVCRTRDLVETGQLPEHRIIGDMYYWTKMAFHGPVACVPRVLSHYVLLRPQTRNDSHSQGTSPVLWARDSRLLVDEVIEASRKAGASSQYLSELQSQAKSYVARSVANQFVWTRIRGARLRDIFRWSVECQPYLAANWTVISRIGAAFLVPRAMLRRALLRSAARMAASRRESKSSTGRESPAVAAAKRQT